MTLQAPVQRRACQVWDGRLQGIKAVVQRQQRVPPEGDDGRLLSLDQDCQTWFLRSGFEILNRLALAPFRNRLGVRRETIHWIVF